MQTLEFENQIVLENNAKLQEESFELLQAKIKLEGEIRKKDAALKMKVKRIHIKLYLNLIVIFIGITAKR